MGEGCHFIDFARWVIGARPLSVACVAAAPAGGSIASAQRFVVAINFIDGSVAAILYGVGGPHATPKEYVEAHAGGRRGRRRLPEVDDLRAPRSADAAGGKTGQGHSAQFGSLVRELASAGRVELDPLESMGTTLEALAAMRAGVEPPVTP